MNFASLARFISVVGMVLGSEPSCDASGVCAVGVGQLPHEAMTEAEAEGFADVEAGVAETNLLQRRLHHPSTGETLPEALREAMDELSRDGDLEKFITQTEGLRSGLELAEDDVPEAFGDLGPGTGELPVQLVDNQEMAFEIQAPAAPEVTLPGGATVTGGKMMPGVIVNASMKLDHFDMKVVVQAYLGIKYATANRWEPPELLTPASDEVIDASKLGSACAQSFTTGGVLTGSEDCLFLNVYTPAGTTADDSKPVMVWIHGGNLVFGSSSQYHGMVNWIAVEGDVVVVTINYRLNVLGFWYSPFGDTKANFGNRDQIMALQWVKKNIAAFGGDPNSVTLFGQSGGARSISVIYMSPLSKGLFHKAIAQSPGFLDANFMQPIEKVGDSMGRRCMENLLCDAAKDPLACMKEATLERLNEACRLWFNPDGYLSKPGYYMSGFDDEVLPHSIRDPLCKGTTPANGDKPAISGTLPHEWRFFDYGLKGPSTGPAMVERFLGEHFRTRFAAVKQMMKNTLFSDGYFGSAACDAPGCSAMSEAVPLQMASNQYGMGALFPLSGGGGGKRFRYTLNIDVGGGPLGSGHCGDLCLLFSGEPWMLPMQKGPCGDGTHKDDWINLGKTIRKMWTDFAKTGEPAPQWTPLPEGERSPVFSMTLGQNASMGGVPFSERSEKGLVRLLCS